MATRNSCLIMHRVPQFLLGDFLLLSDLHLNDLKKLLRNAGIRLQKAKERTTSMRISLQLGTKRLIIFMLSCFKRFTTALESQI